MLGSNPWPLTPEVVTGWAGEESWPFMYRPVFYARLLTRLRPQVSALRNGGHPRPHRSKQDELGRVVQALLEAARAPLLLDSCYREVRCRGGLWNLRIQRFLNEVRNNPNVEIILRTGHQPMVRLRPRVSEPEAPKLPDQHRLQDG
jgi:hypothetical protein